MSRATNRAARRAAKTETQDEAPRVEAPATLTQVAQDQPMPESKPKSKKVKYNKKDWGPESVITLLRKDNPKKLKSRARYDLYRDGMTVAEYGDAVVKAGLGNRTLANNDLRWDTSPDRRFISIAPKSA